MINKKKCLPVLLLLTLFLGIIILFSDAVNAANLSANGGNVKITNSSGSTRSWRGELTGVATVESGGVRFAVSKLLMRNTSAYSMKIQAGGASGRIAATDQSELRSAGKIPSKAKQLQKDQTIDIMSGGSFYWAKGCDGRNVQVRGIVSTADGSWKGTSEAVINIWVPAHEHFSIKYEGLNLSERKCIGKAYRISDKKPTKNGYIFKGWSRNPEGNLHFSAGDLYREDKNLILYPIWEPESPSREYRFMFCI